MMLKINGFARLPIVNVRFVSFSRKRKRWKSAQLRAWSPLDKRSGSVNIIHVRIFVVFACLAGRSWWKLCCFGNPYLQQRLTIERVGLANINAQRWSRKDFLWSTRHFAGKGWWVSCLVFIYCWKCILLMHRLFGWVAQRSILDLLYYFWESEAFTSRSGRNGT